MTKKRKTAQVKPLDPLVAKSLSMNKGRPLIRKWNRTGTVSQSVFAFRAASRTYELRQGISQAEAVKLWTPPLLKASCRQLVRVGLIFKSGNCEE